MPEMSSVRSNGLGRMLRLDLRLLRPMLWLGGFFFLIAAFTLGRGRTDGAAPFLAILPTMALLQLFGAVERDRLTSLFGALPVSRATVMRAHHLTALGIAALTYLPWLFGVAIHAVFPARGVEAGALLGWSAALGVVLVAMAVMTPAIVKWGTSRGVILLLVFAVTAGFVVTLLVSSVHRWERLSAWFGPGLTSPWMMLVLLALGLLVFAGSCVVSTRIYERQDH